MCQRENAFGHAADWEVKKEATGDKDWRVTVTSHHTYLLGLLLGHRQAGTHTIQEFR